MDPEMHFQHSDIAAIYAASFANRLRPGSVTRRIRALREHLKLAMAESVEDFDLELLIVENALSIPMNLPLGLAMTESVAATGLPTDAHHHDFFCERKRDLVHCVWDSLDIAFHPHLPHIRHVVINSSAFLRRHLQALLTVVFGEPAG